VQGGSQPPHVAESHSSSTTGYHSDWRSKEASDSDRGSIAVVIDSNDIAFPARNVRPFVRHDSLGTHQGRTVEERVASLRERAQTDNALLEEGQRLNPEALDAHIEAEVLKLTTKAHEQAVARGRKVRHVQCPGHHAPCPSRCRHAALTMPAVLQGSRMLMGEDGKTYDAGETEDGRSKAAVARGKEVRHVQCCGVMSTASCACPLALPTCSSDHDCCGAGQGRA